MNRVTILDTARDCITRDRAATHGDAEENFAWIAGHWNWWLQDKLMPGAALTPYDVAQMMVGFKQARAKGNPAHMDSHCDAVGYAAIAGEIAARQARSATDSGAPVDDHSLSRQIGELGNQIHNLGCEHQNNEELSERLQELRSMAWELARSATERPAGGPSAPSAPEDSRQPTPGVYESKTGTWAHNSYTDLRDTLIGPATDDGGLFPSGWTPETDQPQAGETERG